ncbi:MAG: hypothetical protein LBQ43_01310 [Holosporales bacterium]|jgi:2-dehydro-3-deoxyglucarate aldolase/4-hydroxy-2-oxoheptanedioate aldolase|nr:hypothetical protein [Holosporales bacterium]
MYKNPFQLLLAKQKYVFGVNLSSRDPVFTEALAQRYDYVWIDWEHTSLDRDNLLGHIIASHSGGAASIVRVPWNNPVLVKPVLDMGPDGVVFPMVQTATEAQDAVAACLYPPKGIRGWGPGRCSGFGIVSDQEYYTQSEERVFKVIQIESKKGVENLHDILMVDGVDAVCIGRCDLAGSLGKMGQWDEMLVTECCEKIAKKVVESGKVLMNSCGFSKTDLTRWIGWGTRLLTIDSDIGMMLTRAEEELEFLRGLQ